MLAGQRQDNAPGALTAQERQLFAVMADGHSDTSIAQQLVVSASAVEKRIGNNFTKLGLPPDDAHHRRVLAVLTYLSLFFNLWARNLWPQHPLPRGVRVGLCGPKLTWLRGLWF
ncbi:helix-turn-helix transcriptional regulator [Streptomyces sp. NPDC059076]|uniref:helix-turn-helix domain-containing protein n=1 Tax=unclassified Streptomyces TaxID=2593676 RepID=UPI0036ADD8D8